MTAPRVFALDPAYPASGNWPAWLSATAVAPSLYFRSAALIALPSVLKSRLPILRYLVAAGASLSAGDGAVAVDAPATRALLLLSVRAETKLATIPCEARQMMYEANLEA